MPLVFVLEPGMSLLSHNQLIEMIEEDNVTALQNMAYSWENLLSTLSYKQRIQTAKEQLEKIKNSLWKLSTPAELSAVATFLSATESFLREVEVLWPAQQAGSPTLLEMIDYLSLEANSAENESLALTSSTHSEIVANTQSAFDLGERAGNLHAAFTPILYRITTIFSTLQKYKDTDAAKYYITNAAAVLSDKNNLPDNVIKALPQVFLEALERRLEAIPLALLKLDICLDKEMADNCFLTLIYPEHREVLALFLSTPTYKETVTAAFAPLLLVSAITAMDDLFSLLLTHKDPSLHIDDVLNTEDCETGKEGTLLHCVLKEAKEIMEISEERFLATLNLILQAGADITKLDHKGNSALMLAMDSKEEAVILLILEQYPQLEVLPPLDKGLLTALSTANATEVRTAACKVLAHFEPVNQALRQIAQLTEKLIKQDKIILELTQRLTLLENQTKLRQSSTSMALSTPVGFISPQALRKSPPSPRPTTENKPEETCKPQALRNSKQ